MINLDRLRERAEEFLEQLSRERLEGLRRPSHGPRLGALYARSDLFELGKISEVQRAVSESSGLEERRARFLLAFLVHGRARRAGAAELDRRLDFETRGAIRVAESSLAPVELPRVLSREPDPEVRRRVERAWLDTLSEEEPVLAGRLARERDVYQELGYGPFLESCELLSGTDLRALSRECERMLAATEGMYRELADWYLPRLAGVDPADASVADRFRLEAAEPLRDVFHETDPLPAALRLLEAVGLDPQTGERLRLERFAASPAAPPARCVPLEIPESVVAAAREQAGRHAHVAAMTALGCALHAAGTEAGLPLEFRWLGDEAVPRAWGRALAGLVDETAWLRDRYGVSRERLRECRRLGALLTLLRVRRRAALLLSALQWCQSDDLAALLDSYPGLLGSATGLRHDARMAIWDLRLPFEIAWEVHAEQLGAVFRLHLREQMDEDWYRNPRAGETLRRLWSDGRRFTAAELAVQLTSGAPSFDPLVALLQEQVR